MTGRERILALLDGKTPDLPGLLPITMMFAAGRAGLDYGRYALDHRVLVESQIKTASDYSLDHVSAITETREAPDCGAPGRFFDNQPYALDEERSLLLDKATLCRLKAPDPAPPPHMSDRLEAIAPLNRRAGDALLAR